MAKISIIVPVYNVEKYLRKCLDSLVNQTLNDIEIICINDGSKDSSLNILNEYAQKDSRIRLINQDNLGVSAARNAGLAVAKGEYVMFVDSDDYLELQTCELAYNKILELDADLLVFDYTKLYNSHKEESLFTKNFSNNECFLFNESPEVFYNISTGVLCKLYKNKHLGFFDVNLKKCEDAVYFWRYCLENNPKITVLNEYLYNYIQHCGSAMVSADYIYRCEIFKSIDEIVVSDALKSVHKNVQAKILSRFAESVCWELYLSRNDLNIELPKTYYEKVEDLIKVIRSCNCSFSKGIIKKLKRGVRKTKFAKFDQFMQNIFSITTVPRRKIVTIAGMQIKFKYLKGQYKKEVDFIKKIEENQKDLPKDTYLLFDCLHDANVECIDAYSLFLYMKETGENVFYAVLKGSKLYEQLESENNLDNIIVIENLSRDYPGDFLEALYDVLLRTKCIVTSFGENSGVVEKFFRKNSFWKYIFIQHGQISLSERTLLSKYLYSSRFDKFLVSSENEANIFKKYGFTDEQLIKCGLPRWDLLCDITQEQEKSILVMFTWRDMTPEKFEKSMYRSNLLKFLNNSELMNYLKEHNVKLYFAPHHALAGNIGVDFNISSNYVQVVESQEISKYIKKCSCLVTDFSSVAFDFMFQDKPVLFYILDRGDTALNPLEKADIESFEIKKELVPNVYYDETFTIEKLKYYIENNFVLESEVSAKYDKFFYTKENIRQQLTQKIREVG